MNNDKFSTLLTTHGFLGNRYQAITVYNDVVPKTATSPLRQPEEKQRRLS